MNKHFRKSKISTAFDDFNDGGYNAGSFCGVGAAMIGAAVVGAAASANSANAAKGAANTQANAATNAANAQLQATNNTNALQWQEYQQTLANNSPYMQTGQMALSALQNGLGLGATQAYSGSGQPMPNGTSSANQGATYTNSQGQTVDSNGNVVTAAGGQAPTNYGASQAQLNTAANSIGAGSLTKQFDNTDLNAQLAPNYAFQLGQGEQQLQASAAARGGLLTGQGAKDINDYAQNSAAGAYQQAFTNWNTQQNQLVGRLSSLAGIGSTATNSSNTAGQNVASGIASNTQAGIGAANGYNTGAAAANAAGAVGSANAWGSFAGGLSNSASSWAALQGLNQNGGTTYANRPTSGQITLSDGSTFTG